ncbi:ectonucleotide pyrophosphatase/phosphodiesterase [Candidatus Colwellia aromaticivorans]|uniref:alkaline phosphatase family protein n=1 Tax=Candidatus Colwellia aromaticivorans TaxID=2267621 RepID=UPI000DF2C862|nr:ectonucleotide pyrophosphatase/phosphodiesterase [Candidatus Colwellia aromaticivorans]
MIRPLSILSLLLISLSAYGITAKTTVILLSVDGFSFNYLQKYQPKNILAFAENGVKARLLPVYPSKTFPNHLSIITGSYPINHGIIHNRFYHPELDKTYYLGSGKENDTWLTAAPFWSVAEDNLIKSAVYFWPESESKGHTSPSYNIPYNKNTSNKARIEQLIAWLKLPINQRPYFIASYFSTIDSAGHDYGLDSPQLITAINEFDKLFGYFIDKINNEVYQPINIILVSDHGMVAITEKAKVLTPLIFKGINVKIDGIKVTYNDTQLFIYLDKNKISSRTRISFEKKLQSNLTANKKLYNIYSKGNYPQHWQFNSDLAIVPEIIIEATPPAIFIWKNIVTKLHGATHGFDPKKNTSLDGFFIAAGSSIAQSRVLEPFQNIHVFPLMNTLLGLNENREIDGQQLVLETIIK